MKILQYVKSIHFLAIGLLIALSSCSTDSAEPEILFSSPEPLAIEADGPPIELGEATQSYQYIYEELWIFFETFAKEAKYRGVVVELGNGDIHIDAKIMEGEATATSIYDADKAITFLTLNRELWINADSSLKELIMFHHLARIKLERDYNNEKTPNGICKSILREDMASCVDNYNANTRDAYLDELFR